MSEGRSGGFFSEVLGKLYDELFHIGSNGKSFDAEFKKITQ